MILSDRAIVTILLVIATVCFALTVGGAPEHYYTSAVCLILAGIVYAQIVKREERHA